jgi:hypothetical protein
MYYFLSKAGNWSPDQENPSFCRTQEFITSVNEILPLVTVLSQFSPFHILTIYPLFVCKYQLPWVTLSSWLHRDAPHEGKWPLMSSVTLSVVSAGSECIMGRQCLSVLRLSNYRSNFSVSNGIDILYTSAQYNPHITWNLYQRQWSDGMWRRLVW